VIRLAGHFGLFQFAMTVIGWSAGLTIHSAIGSYDHWVAFALLVGIGLKMIYEAFQAEAFRGQTDPTRGVTVLLLSLATSMDALAVGLSLSFLRVNIWYPSVVIGLVAAALTALGMTTGRKAGARLGVAAKGVGGVVLIGIGIAILLRHAL
jgi:putative Mn2+ efflux pump MntP